MIRRVAMLIALVAVVGLLVFGGIHRTQSILASEMSQGSTSEQTHDAGEASGQGRHGGGSAGSYTE